jgi:N-acetylmuramoyl-L-alanine amidase
MVSSKLSSFGTQTGVRRSRKSGFRGTCLLSGKQISLLFSSFILLACSLHTLAEPVVESVRVWRAPDNTRLVFDLDGPVSHSIFELSNPERLVIDMPAVSFKANVDNLETADTPVNAIRTGRRDDGGLRVVLDLDKKVKPRTFSLAPNESYGNRLVVDLFDKNERVEKSVADLTEVNRDIVIAIDAGHGGEDPGALGPGGVREKDVVMGISKALKQAIDAQPGYSAVLVRTNDYYVPLRDRFARARENRADMFISIHADSFRMPSVRGASVYALSTKGATSEMASYLAQKENRADLIGGAGSLSLKDKDDQLASVLLDLSMNATLDSSLRLGDLILTEMGAVTRLHKKHVEQAGFAVLKSPDVPSLLIETGFISNPEDARNLATASFQNRLAKSIFQGVRNYFDNYPPAGTLVASVRDQGGRTYVIQSGDTLSEIAERFNVSLNSLRMFNNINSSVIRVGQQISIPTT